VVGDTASDSFESFEFDGTENVGHTVVVVVVVVGDAGSDVEKGSEIARMIPSASAASRCALPAAVTRTSLNVATPSTEETVVVPARDPGPAARVSVTDAVESVTVLPNASWTVTTGCVANATPATVEEDGWVVNARFDAVAKVMSNVLDVAEVKEPDAADNVSPVPAVSTFKPANVTTPFTAFTEDVPDNVPELRVNEIESLAVVTVLP
jgi:hypothetical protein